MDLQISIFITQLRCFLMGVTLGLSVALVVVMLEEIKEKK